MNKDYQLNIQLEMVLRRRRGPKQSMTKRARVNSAKSVPCKKDECKIARFV